MTNPTAGRRGDLRAAAAAVLLLLTGCGGAAQTGAGHLDTENTPPAGPVLSAEAPVTAPSSPAVTPDTAAPADAPVPVPGTPQVTSPPSPERPVPAMAESVPESLNIPSVGARSSLIRLDVDSKGSLEVPSGRPGSPAGWYIHSPTPGEPGPAVILGHVNAEGGGPGIFADLRKLQPGDEVEIIREDGSTAVFSVQHGEQYPKDAFPSEKVYGNTEGPELRLITCDGYDPKAGTFADNYVVYARLVH
ncbi:class F sortase [Arthrobacter sp. zg-Y820]|uniref:class F sortase n=1 Tax=unclassified Arthrobacter TaxID=235627 RepID=UPI001E358E80|nr:MULTISPECIES: class F sortase [unclassified Arthrobacter]MCC9197528.1 class F sortase [Arthrobacter sp. zg-Y820]MDK1280395.1 class F sortase [Arthrobacter sp. zg.Y820]MDK1360470.1 class F sortase [Arthrobacter sp. zg-Y1219]WIB09674.1 class F sortase [Arthrobacter sp. zg-Y820]